MNKLEVTIKDIIENYKLYGDNKPINIYGANSKAHFVEFYAYNRLNHTIQSTITYNVKPNSNYYTINVDLIKIKY